MPRTPKSASSEPVRTPDETPGGVVAVPIKVRASLLQPTPEAEIDCQLGRIFAADDTLLLWRGVEDMGARRFLRSALFDAPEHERLRAYMRDLMRETGTEPAGRFIGRNETTGEFILRATNELFRKAGS